jgi:hypothetical protein
VVVISHAFVVAACSIDGKLIMLPLLMMWLLMLWRLEPVGIMEAIANIRSPMWTLFMALFGFLENCSFLIEHMDVVVISCDSGRMQGSSKENGSCFNVWQRQRHRLHVIHSFYPIQHKHEAMHLRTSTLV